MFTNEYYHIDFILNILNFFCLKQAFSSNCALGHCFFAAFK